MSHENAPSPDSPYIYKWSSLSDEERPWCETVRKIRVTPPRRKMHYTTNALIEIRMHAYISGKAVEGISVEMDVEEAAALRQALDEAIAVAVAATAPEHPRAALLDRGEASKG
jgi:hypothetical protein